jgi:hypothetical protein
MAEYRHSAHAVCYVTYHVVWCRKYRYQIMRGRVAEQARDHLVLGLLALRNDDVATARSQLLEAGKTPGSPQLNSFGLNMMPASELLKRGERDAVIE